MRYSLQLRAHSQYSKNVQRYTGKTWVLLALALPVGNWICHIFVSPFHLPSCIFVLLFLIFRVAQALVHELTKPRLLTWLPLLQTARNIIFKHQFFVSLLEHSYYCLSALYLLLLIQLLFVDKFLLIL